LDSERLNEEDDSGEFSFAEVAAFAWSKRGIFLAGILISLLFAGLWLAFSKVSEYEEGTEYIIQFRFDGRSDNRYPNGSRFSLGDIVAPAILSEVYLSERIADAGISVSEFQSSITIAPYTAERKLIIERYQNIDTRKASTAELAEAQRALAQELNSESSRFAILRYTTAANGLPASKRANVLIQTVKVWERVAIESRAVLKLDIATVVPEVFSEKSTTGMGRLSALSLVSENAAKLTRFLTAISQRPGANSAVDTESGSTVTALLARVEAAMARLAALATNWPQDSSPAQAETMRAPIELYSPALFTETGLEKLDYLVMIDLLEQRRNLLEENAARIRESEFGPVTEDPTTKLTIGDVQKRLADVQQFTMRQLVAPVLSLAIAKNPEAVRLYYGFKLEELQREKNMLAAKAGVLVGANQTYLNSNVSGAPAQSSASGGPAVAEFSAAPQIGDAFLDRIIQLTQKSEDSGVRQKLLDGTVEYQQVASEIDKEIARISEYIQRFSGASDSAVSNSQSQTAMFTKTVEEQLPIILASMKEMAEITERIAYRLRMAQDIHSILQGRVKDREIDYYLRSRSADGATTMQAVLGDLHSITEAGNRIYLQTSVMAFGKNQMLYDASVNPQQIRSRLVTRFDLLVLGLAIVAGVTLSLLFVAALMFLPRQKKAHSAV
jgi:hypothetical protein